jgi:frataxin
LWYSSTVSGPQRFNYSEGRWLNSKEEEIDPTMKEDIRAMLAI